MTPLPHTAQNTCSFFKYCVTQKKSKDLFFKFLSVKPERLKDYSKLKTNLLDTV